MWNCRIASEFGGGVPLDDAARRLSAVNNTITIENYKDVRQGHDQGVETLTMRLAGTSRSAARADGTAFRLVHPAGR